MTTPDHVGPYGAAYDIHERLAAQYGDQPHAGVASWLIDAPNQTPFWRWYRITAIHLRPIPDWPSLDPVITEPGATHEWLLLALDPGADPGIDNPSSWVRWMRPANFVGQYIVAGDAEHSDTVAAEITDRAAWAVVNGHLWAEPMLSGQTEPWHTLLQNTISHYRDGVHQPEGYQ